MGPTESRGSTKRVDGQADTVFSAIIKRSVVEPLAKKELQQQAQSWSRHASRYDELFLDPYSPSVQNPLWETLAAVPDTARKTVADLGCGTGPLLPYLAERFQRIIALDFAPRMLERAAERLQPKAAARVTFLERPMHKLDDLAGQVDVVVAVNSLIMPDVRLVDRTLRAIRASLRPGGLFLGIVPSIDAICYHIMLLVEHALDEGYLPREAQRLASLHAERRHYDFVFGQFRYHGLHQKFWRPFEIEYRLNKAGFASTGLRKVLYPWDENLAGADKLVGFPPSWDWFFRASG
jgi:SAM-dependent methyltransferase